MPIFIVKLKPEEQEQLKTLIEEFWEFESEGGACLEAKQAAWQLQQKLHYKTDYDEAREKAIIPKYYENPAKARPKSRGK